MADVPGGLESRVERNSGLNITTPPTSRQVAMSSSNHRHRHAVALSRSIGIMDEAKRKLA